MVERSAEEPRIVLIDTNVIIEGAIHLANDVDSPEARIWHGFLRSTLKAAFSDILLLEVTTVSRRLMGKDFASKLRAQVLDRVEIISEEKIYPHVSQLSGKVPKEDVAHAALATAVEAEYIISNNREFLRSLKGKFKCVTPKSFAEMLDL